MEDLNLSLPHVRWQYQQKGYVILVNETFVLDITVRASLQSFEIISIFVSAMWKNLNWTERNPVLFAKSVLHKHQNITEELFSLTKRRSVGISPSKTYLWTLKVSAEKLFKNTWKSLSNSSTARSERLKQGTQICSCYHFSQVSQQVLQFRSNPTSSVGGVMWGMLGLRTKTKSHEGISGI